MTFSYRVFLQIHIQVCNSFSIHIFNINTNMYTVHDQTMRLYQYGGCACAHRRTLHWVVNEWIRATSLCGNAEILGLQGCYDFPLQLQFLFHPHCFPFQRPCSCHCNFRISPTGPWYLGFLQKDGRTQRNHHLATWLPTDFPWFLGRIQHVDLQNQKK